jgi:prevent-host-death family protein
MGPGQDERELVRYVSEKRALGWTFALICRQGRASDKPHFPYAVAQRLGKRYDAQHGKPKTIIRRLPGERDPNGAIRIPARELRNDSVEILRQVEAGQRFVITISGREVAELTPLASKSVFVPRSVVESLIREAPLDPGFASDVDAALSQRVDEL